MNQKTSIGIVAPARALAREDADRVSALVAETFDKGRSEEISLHFHSQCFLNNGHFAGDDPARSAAFIETANDPSIDAIWFARGGYGSCRLEETAFTHLTDCAKEKTYMGYSDTCAILGRLYAMGFDHIIHGPMPADINRHDGEAAVIRAIRYFSDQSHGCIDSSCQSGEKLAAFNIKLLSHLLGTSWVPDLSGHVLLLEDVAEYHYQLDRSMFTITSNKNVQACAGIRLGRCSSIPENDIDFGLDEEEITKYWCNRHNIQYLGRADIGHDSQNKIVPFGLFR